MFSQFFLDPAPIDPHLELITVSEPQKNLLSQLLSTFVSGHCTKLGIFFQQKVSFKKYYSYLETAMLEQQFENV